MANKENQEALDWLTNIIIEKYEDEFGYSDEIFNAETKAIYEHIEVMLKAIDDLDFYEKALDKACEELEQFEYTLSNYHYNEHKTKEQWKEYLLESEEK